MLVAEKQFRMDLYYRLNVFPVAVPPLRHRLEDIPTLVAHFALRYAERMAKQIEKIPSDSMEALVRYPWPGNIRELQNFIERAVILSQGDVLRLPALPSIAAAPNEPVTLEEGQLCEHNLRRRLSYNHYAYWGKISPVPLQRDECGSCAPT